MSITMTLLVGLTVIFVLYTLYILITVALKGCPHEEVGAPPPPAAPEAEEAKPEPEAPAAEAEQQPSAGETRRVKQLRNPETGETAAVPTHYRFAKRWIKEAMVKEGLLDRIYKNTELQDEAADRRVREALEKFKALEKYWA